ncbi:MAG: bifunctional isocitrate dehydrogenase kinase/phosphatase [Gammaproteobacteria bacterium RIFCSPLOWO2_12_FULL_52_10]|nr:MAG: bifunctional isocitrate dehydrogenase kinase/phosphatase [Gammaproteobacteria bacterium RIFCSPLOWO2_12_FULL_52_10]
MANDKTTIAIAAQLVYEGFLKYNKDFSRISGRARKRFEQRDWRGHQQDIVRRVELYEKSIRRNAHDLEQLIGPDVRHRSLWRDIKQYFGERLGNVPDAGFMKTFFNSISRRIFGTVGVDPELEFVSPAPDEGIKSFEALSLKRYPYWKSIERMFKTILTDFSFKVPYKDIVSDCKFIAAEIDYYSQTLFKEGNGFLRFEFIDSFFYQSARAYLVGRIILHHQITPIVIAFENTPEGISIDAVLMTTEQVSMIFSYTRSYYFSDPSSVIGAVQFLHSILPHKHIDELYTVMGRLRQGKTERYRLFSNHLNSTDDKFVHAEGDKGLVMIVFTLPSYNLVFKIIRDKFGYPKNITRKQVVEKYKLVSKHDLAGRLIDTQEFRNLEFPLDRFAPLLLEELRQDATQSVYVRGNKLVIDHVYIERRVRPLNLYIKESSRQEAEQAILDYGQTLKDLAQTNIFPGDLLLKNFGVTRHRRVVFYDYDEVALVSECNFRELPEPPEGEELMNPNTWMYISEHDIFPEEFIKFMAIDGGLRSLFLDVHGDITTADYWRNIKAAHLAGTVPLVIPYHQSARNRDKTRQFKSS